MVVFFDYGFGNVCAHEDGALATHSTLFLRTMCSTVCQALEADVAQAYPVAR